MKSVIGRAMKFSLSTRDECYTCCMRMQLARSCACLLLMTVAGYAAPPIELELVTERGVQITAPHEWLQLLASIGVDDVRIRGRNRVMS